MQKFTYASHDFDVWAAAVKQQMLQSLAKRRSAGPTNLHPVATLHRLEDCEASDQLPPIDRPKRQPV